MAATDLGRYMGVVQILNPLVSVFLNSAARAAWPALQAATAPCGDDWIESKKLRA